MKLTKKQLLDVTITIDTKATILSFIADYVRGGSDSGKKTPLVIATPNPEQLVEASVNREFLLALNRSDVAIPDGIGIVFGMRLLHGIKLSQISGIDFLADLVRLANKQHWTIGFVGGKNDAAHKALITLQSSYVELHGWSEQPKEFSRVEEIMSSDMSKIVRRIIDSQTRFVFVGLGAPKQEFFIDMLKKQLIQEHTPPVVLMSVGGSFDMIAGNISRAPAWMRNLHVEWFYRLMREPWRWKRQTALFQFLWQLLFYRSRNARC